MRGWMGEARGLLVAGSMRPYKVLFIFAKARISFGVVVLLEIGSHFVQ